MKAIFEKTFANIYKLSIFAVLLFVAAITYYAKENIEPIYQQIYHFGFLFICIIMFFVFLIFDKIKPFLFILTLFVSYLILNYLRNNLLLETPLYYNLGVFICINLSVIPFISEAKIVCRKSFLFVLFFLVELFLIETLSKQDIFIVKSFLSVAVICGSILFLYSSVKNEVISFGFFYAFLAAVMGYYYAYNTSAFTMFFGVSLIICTLCCAFYLYFNLYYNQFTNIKNKKAFLIYAKQKVVKCALAIIYVDDIKTLENKFNRTNFNTLIMLISEIIKEKHIKVFQISSSEFVVVFENVLVDDAYEEVESIRRKIATTDFVLKGYKMPIKLSISAAVVERKRSNIDIFDVFKKAEKLLAKTKNFNNNFTSKG